MKKFELTFTEEDRKKCLKVVEAFQEYFEDLGDTTVADCGKFGMMWLRWYDGFEFGAQELHDNAYELFEALWTAWKEHQLLTPVLGTPVAELEYDELYDLLQPEQKKGYEQKKEYFWKKAFGDEQMI